MFMTILIGQDKSVTSCKNRKWFERSEVNWTGQRWRYKGVVSIPRSNLASKDPLALSPLLSWRSTLLRLWKGRPPFVGLLLSVARRRAHLGSPLPLPRNIRAGKKRTAGQRSEWKWQRTCWVCIASIGPVSLTLSSEKHFFCQLPRKNFGLESDAQQ